MSILVNELDFEEEVINSDMPVMVDFFAHWCGPCKLIGPAVEAISEEFEGKAKVVKVDIDESQKLADKYQIMGVPTLVYFKGGETVDQIVGAVSKDVMMKKLESLL